MKLSLFQFVRFGVVGLASNAVAYGLYLVLTAGGVEYRLAMTLLYIMGVVQSYFFNRSWTFRSGGSSTVSFMRYVVTYLIGYVIQYGILQVLVDGVGYSHQVVMAGVVFLMAIYFFLMQKFWVFRGGVA